MTDQDRERSKAARPHWQVVEEALAGPAKPPRRRRRRRPRASAAPAATLPVVYVTDEMARRSAAVLTRPRAGLRPPRTVFWLGVRCGARACVTTLIVPVEESGAGGDAVLASAVANDEIFSAVVGASLVYLGQVRSRPALTQQPSPTAAPDADGRYDGALCVELPPDGEGAFVLEDCLVWRHIAGERRQIAAGELAAHLRLVPAFKDLRRRGSAA